MEWAAQRARLLSKAPALSVDEILSSLRDRDAQMYVDADGLHTTMSDLGPEILAGIDAHRTELTELFAYTPEGRCVFTACYRLRAAGDLISCGEHRTKLDVIVMPWETSRD